MIKIKKIILLSILLAILHGCGGIKEAGKVMRNEKIRTTDEFLVEKRDPLTLPPDYNSLPVPGSLKKTKEQNELNKILNIPKENITKKKSKTNIEQSIINKIGK